MRNSRTSPHEQNYLYKASHCSITYQFHLAAFSLLSCYYYIISFTVYSFIYIVVDVHTYSKSNQILYYSNHAHLSYAYIITYNILHTYQQCKLQWAVAAWSCVHISNAAKYSHHADTDDKAYVVAYVLLSLIYSHST